MLNTIFFVCPMGQRMENVGKGTRISSNGYESQITYYQAKRCETCPLRGQCHQAKGNRRIEVNHRLNALKHQAKELLMSEKGLEHRSKRPIEVEAVFGQLKSNNKFNRFTFKGLEKVGLEFLLMALGHNFRKMVAVTASEGKTVFKNTIFGSKTIIFVQFRFYQRTLSLKNKKSNNIEAGGKLAA